MILDSLSPLAPEGQSSEGAGALSRRAPVPSLFWPATLVLAGLFVFGVSFESEMSVAIAVAVMLAGGLPHGAYDIELARKALRLGLKPALALLGAYVAVAAVMFVLWTLAPLAALALFLALAAVHFGEDWHMLESGLLRTMAGASILCIPAFAKPDEVAALFVTMAGPGADFLAHLAIACAPVALLVTLVGMLQALRGGNRGWVAAQGSAFVALASLPPQVGFMLYFVFLHSPLHMRGLGSALGHWSLAQRWIYGSVICALSLIAGAFLLPDLLSEQGLAVSSAGFQLLSIVAAPHLLLTLYVERHVSRRV